jgi:nicotinamidase/pyrazinamidase
MWISPRNDDVLIVVDVQHDFLPGGSLAVPGGDEIIAPLNALARRFAHVVMTQDWHPAEHISFASNHSNAQPFQLIELPYGQQVLWPDHCIWNTHGAAFSAQLDIPHCEMIIRKGYNEVVDSYSGFQEADRASKTGLEGYLRERGFKRLFVAGLATDFCVNWTAQDARSAGFETFVVEDLTRAIDTNGSLAAAWTDMTRAGVRRISSNDIA